MAKSNRERVGEIMDLLKSGLGPFVLSQYKSVYRGKYLEELELQLYDGGVNISLPGEAAAMQAIDAQSWLKTVFYSWNKVFKDKLGHSERSYVSILMDARNKWAHQAAFSNDDAQHVADIARRLLEAINATEEAALAERHNNELARLKYERQARNASLKPPKSRREPRAPPTPRSSPGDRSSSRIPMCATGVSPRPSSRPIWALSCAGKRRPNTRTRANSSTAPI